VSDTWTILRVLDWTRETFEKRGVDNPRLDAELLIAKALGIPRIMLYARFDQPLGRPELDAVRALVKRRAGGEPVAYIEGTKEFWSLDLEVSPAVLIPRPDTERLVELAIAEARARLAEAPTLERPLRVVDVGTGSGAIAIALAKELASAEVHATDVSGDALAVAARNVARHGVGVTLHHGPLLAPVDGAFDVVAANLPYIPTADIAGLMRDVRAFEPHLALDGGPDGLALYDALLAALPARLHDGARVLFEADGAQLDVLATKLRAAGFVDVDVTRDLAQQPRVAHGRWPGAGRPT
jgi:release factor glutamine methyltransferase